MGINTISPRDRMLAALNYELTDYTPCSFMMYKGLLVNCSNYLEFLQKQLDMGLNPYAMIPPRPPVVENDHYNLHGIAVNFDPSVEVREWIEERKGEEFPVMVKEYHTPAGKLRAEVRQTEDWRWGNHVPIFDDFITPRTVKYLISAPEEIEALRYLLVPPTDNERVKIQNESAPVINFAKENKLLTLGGWGIGADMLGWIYGFENMIYAASDCPETVETILRVISEWNQSRMVALLEMGIDVYIKRAWYETCNFWSPKTFEKFLLPIIKKEAELTHQYGAKFGYIATDKVSPLLPLIKNSGIDVLIGIDPHTYDLNETKKVLDRTVSLWGGLNGHLTIELGSESEVRAEVQNAMMKLSPGGGFILSPIDNVREDTENSRRNVNALIDEWKKWN